MGVRTNDESEPTGAGTGPVGSGGASGPAAERPDRGAGADGGRRDGSGGTGGSGTGEGAAPDAAAAAVLAEAIHPRPGRADDRNTQGDTHGDMHGDTDKDGERVAGMNAQSDSPDAEAGTPGAGTDVEASEPGTPDSTPGTPALEAPEAPEAAPKPPSRRPPSLTRDTARPEGGGRAAPGGAPAPARQWPLLTVLSLAGLGLIVVGTDAFADAFRVGTMLIGVALITGAAMRRTLPSVGMLAVRSRFTDMVTYGLLGTLIVLLALVTQPKPWLDVPFLEDAVHFTVR
ncbi:DUF3017 domain-containing protein [Streptomyces sp. NBC_00829]|uniref:DUF3017 domain-containing protein n=1 Tax=Streptomyces sp. NBC_00829 TaxID=2903679 RepID=UPI0038707C39|nr:DUF3017 domain-containing protein [Streptomyces sp. NBC_00829]